MTNAQANYKLSNEWAYDEGNPLIGDRIFYIGYTYRWCNLLNSGLIFPQAKHLTIGQSIALCPFDWHAVHLNDGQSLDLCPVKPQFVHFFAQFLPR